MSLARILNAQSVAIIGASRQETKRGFQAIRTLIEEKFEGPIYPVNPNEDTVLGLKCYPSVLDIEGNVDLALVVTPARTIPSILKQCGKKDVAGAVVIAAGFGETGGRGKQLEREIVEIGRKYGVRIVGPNTNGLINVHTGLNLVGFRNPPKGDIALLSQSGNMALSLFTEAQVKSRKGFSCYVGVGNEADIRFHEYLKYFREDEKTRAILIYVEGMRQARAFLQEAYQTTRTKPIVLLKSGRSASGRRSAGSHTGALAGMSEVAVTAFRRAGITVVENSDELFPAIEALSSLPVVRNGRIALLADGGGHATIAADILSEAGIELPPLHEKTRNKLASILPPNASLRNPVDVAGGADSDPVVLAECARMILQDHDIDGLLLVGLFGGYSIRFSSSLEFAEEDAAHRIGKLVRETSKPIVCHSLYNYAKPHSLDLLRYYGIPVFDSLEIAAKAMILLSEYGDYVKSYHAQTNFELAPGKKAKKGGQEIISRALQQGRRVLLETEARELCEMHKIPVVPARLARTPDEAAEAAREFLPKPVVLKIVSPDIVHKSDVGGVRLNLQDEQQVRLAFEEIHRNVETARPDARIEGVLVSPMVRGIVEVIIGTKIDEQFGPVMVFGIGGIMVEVLQDVSYRVLPLSAHSAKKMIEEIRSVKLLNGFRGEPPADKKALQRLLLSVAALAEAYPQIQEMDFNPVLLHEQGLTVLDARIILHEDGQDFTTSEANRLPTAG